MAEARAEAMTEDNGSVGSVETEEEELIVEETMEMRMKRMERMIVEMRREMRREMEEMRERMEEKIVRRCKGMKGKEGKDGKCNAIVGKNADYCYHHKGQEKKE